MPLAVPSVQDRHLLNRFSYGITPALLADAQAAGGARAWFEDQLTPKGIGDAYATSMRAWFPSLDMTPKALFDGTKDGTQPSHQTGADLQRWTLLRRAYSRRQVHELMADFWSNLLHVAAPQSKAMPHRSRYDRTVRTYALGRFTDLLPACVLHPSMLCFLDNAVSTKKEINENLGRELLELHTVGIGAGYGEDGVRQSANILTGYRVESNWDSFYSGADHVTGQVRVLDFSHTNAEPDGRPVALAYLHYLATHPLTAERVARRLCVRFVSDDPSDAIVGAVAQTFLDSGTNIKATLRALVNHPEFAASVDAKTRTPTEDGIATMRALDVRPQAPQREDDFANAVIHLVGNTGQRPFDWPRPDGFPDVADAWTGVNRMLGAWQMHWGLSGGYWPKTGVTYREPHFFLPPLPATFDQVVDHLSRRFLSRPATEPMYQAASQYAEVARTKRIAAAGDIGTFRLVKVMSVVLDTPAHMSR